MENKTYDYYLLLHIDRCIGSAWWSCNTVANMAHNLHHTSEDCKYLYCLLSRFMTFDDPTVSYNETEFQDYLIALAKIEDTTRVFNLRAIDIEKYYVQFQVCTKFPDYANVKPSALVGFAKGQV